MGTQPPKPIPFTQEGGLILSQPLEDIGSDSACDLLDVDWSSSDVLRSREGAEAFTPKAGADNYGPLFPHSVIEMLTRRGTTLVVLSELTGEEIPGEELAVSADHLSFARLGVPPHLSQFTYIADGSSTIKRYGPFSEPTAVVDGAPTKAMPKGKFLAAWTDQGNRLVVAGTDAEGGPNGAASGSSHVWFSNPGNAEEYESTAFVQVGVAEAEGIIGCCAWGGEIFVFKQTHLFVFYGISPDAEGKPIFNFRTIDLGTTLLPPTADGGDVCTVGEEGVYFVSNDGLWVTTGGEPTLLSEDLDALAYSDPLVGPAATTFGDLRWSDVKGITFLNGAIYIGLGATTTELLLKLDLRALRWTVWQAALNCFVPWDAGGGRSRIFFSASAVGKEKVYLYTPAEDTDPTVDMEPRWRTGLYDLEEADEKTLVMAKLWGTGDVTLKVAEDYKALDGGTVFTLGEAPAIAQEQHQVGQTATFFSHEFSGEAPWSVQRLHRYLRETRVAETQKP